MSETLVDDLDADLDTAARHATARVPLAAPGDLVGDVRSALLGRSFDSAAVVAVLDGDRLSGLVTLERLLAAEPSRSLAEIMDPDPPVVRPGTDQERAAWLAVQHTEPTLAVADETGRFVGVVPATTLVGILLAEHDEDMARLGGFLRSASPARATMAEPVWQRFVHRLPWLVVGLAGALVTAGVVNGFEEQLARNVLIAFFIPGVVYMADAVGTQTETLVIRGLSVGVPLRSVIGRELVTGLLLGVALAAASLAAVWAVWGDGSIALALALALFAACAVATVIAMVLPWAIRRAGGDPAFGSGPLSTVLQDLATVTIYLWLASSLT